MTSFFSVWASQGSSQTTPDGHGSHEAVPVKMPQAHGAVVQARCARALGRVRAGQVRLQPVRPAASREAVVHVAPCALDRSVHAREGSHGAVFAGVHLRKHRVLPRGAVDAPVRFFRARELALGAVAAAVRRRAAEPARLARVALVRAAQDLVLPGPAVQA